MGKRDTPERLRRDLPDGALETRDSPAVGGVTVRADDDGGEPVIEGYGSVSDTPSRVGGMFAEWDEEVAPGAWSCALEDGADVRSMFNHDKNQLLARTVAGDLRLSEDSEGLRYEIDVDRNDPDVMRVYAKVKRGNVSGSSVWFRVLRQEFTTPTEENGLDVPKRRILEGELFETGPVVFPAFETTTAVAREARVVDGVLRSAGVDAEQRARLTSDLLSDPETVEQRVAEFFDAAPDLRDLVRGTIRDTVVETRTQQPPRGHKRDAAAAALRKRGTRAYGALTARKGQ